MSEQVEDNNDQMFLFRQFDCQWPVRLWTSCVMSLNDEDTEITELKMTEKKKTPFRPYGSDKYLSKSAIWSCFLITLKSMQLLNLNTMMGLYLNF